MKTALFIALLCCVNTSWAKGQVAPRPSVNDYLHDEHDHVESSSSQAVLLYQSAHEGHLTFEEQKRDQVFIDDDFQSAPGFSEKTGMDPQLRSSSHVLFRPDPSREIYDKVYSEWKTETERRNYRNALSNQFSENLKKAGLSTKRNLANELELLELKQNSATGGK